MTRLALAFGALLINSAYLAASASPSLFYFSNILIHVALGIALAIVCLRPWGFSASLAQSLGAATRHTFTGTAARQITWAVIVAAAISGVALVFVGATTPNMWLVRGHIATSVAGTFLLLVSVVWAAARARSAQVRAAAAIGVMCIVLARRLPPDRLRPRAAPGHRM